MTLGCDLMLVSSLLRAMMVSSNSRILVSFSDSASGSPLMLTRDGVLNIIEGEVLSGERDREADMVLSPAPGPSSAWNIDTLLLQNTDRKCHRSVGHHPALDIAPDKTPVVDVELVILQVAHHARVASLHLPHVFAQLLPALANLSGQ